MTLTRPQKTTAYLLVVVACVLGFDAASWLSATDLSWSVVSPAVAIFSAMLLLLEWRPFPSLSQPQLMVFSWTFAYTLIFLVPLPVVLLVVAVCVGPTQLFHGAQPLKAAFNVANLQGAIALGWLAGSLIGDPLSVSIGGEVSIEWIAVVIITCSVGLLASSILVGVAISLHQGMRIEQMIWATLKSNAASEGPLLVLTPIFVVIGVYGPLLLPLLLVSSWMVINSSTIAMRNAEEATHDELTGLPNRRSLNVVGALALETAASRNADLAVMQLDLDGFKDVNDRLGHKFGDEVLQIVSKRLAASTRSTDHLFRLGGDEFALILGGCDQESARTFARACLEAIEAPMKIDGLSIAISGSFGVASYQHESDDLRSLLHRADLAMYLAKRARSGVEVDSDGSTIPEVAGTATETSST